MPAFTEQRQIIWRLHHVYNSATLLDATLADRLKGQSYNIIPIHTAGLTINILKVRPDSLEAYDRNCRVGPAHVLRVIA